MKTEPIYCLITNSGGQRQGSGRVVDEGREKVSSIAGWGERQMFGRKEETILTVWD